MILNVTSSISYPSVPKKGADPPIGPPSNPENTAQETPQSQKKVKGELVHSGMNPFFQWLNGKLEPQNPKNPTLYESTSGYLLNAIKTIWTATPVLQLFGLVNKRADMFARAVYGTCWSIVYSCLRPFKADAELLTDEGAKAPISNTIKSLDKANEHFRLGMGTLVSAIYGGGALGMLWNAITGNEEGFEGANKLYQKGMLDQNQVFASMNTAICLRRKYNENQLGEEDKKTGNIKSTAELIDSVLFLPNIIARGIDTVDFLGWQVSDGLGKAVNALGYFSYGTWAARFGSIKEQEFKGAGALEPKNENLNGSAKTLDDALYNTQKYGARTFWTTLPILSFLSSGLELLGSRDLAKNVFKLEGILERLNPTIAAWCLRNPVLSKLIKGYEGNPDQTQIERKPDIQNEDVAAEIK